MSFESAFYAQQRSRIAEERQKAVDLVSSGRCVDLAEYKYSVGYIKALDDIVQISEEILIDANKG